MSSLKQKFNGVVVSTAPQKTAIVRVDRKIRHPKYHKIFTTSKKFAAHTEEILQVGDKVTIEACSPISKTKRFKVVK
jgi:small subunit ribosomal protein S17